MRQSPGDSAAAVRRAGEFRGRNTHFRNPVADDADCGVVHVQELTDLPERVLVRSCGEEDHFVVSLLVVSIREEGFETWSSRQ